MGTFHASGHLKLSRYAAVVNCLVQVFRAMAGVMVKLGLMMWQVYSQAVKMFFTLPAIYFSIFIFCYLFPAASMRFVINRISFPASTTWLG